MQGLYCGGAFLLLHRQAVRVAPLKFGEVQIAGKTTVPCTN